MKKDQIFEENLYQDGGKKKEKDIQRKWRKHLGRCPKNKINVLRDRVENMAFMKEEEWNGKKRKSSKKYLRKILITDTHVSPKRKDIHTFI